MKLDIAVNGVELQPGQEIVEDDLQRAGMKRLPGWRCLLRRLPSGFRYWEATDPRIVCFAGQLDIFACRDSYLDEDRKWGTALMLSEHEGRLQWLNIRIIDGVYAAGNYYNSFYDSAAERFGQPGRNGRRQAAWQLDDLRIEANLSDDAKNAVFLLAWQPDRCGAGIPRIGPADQHVDQVADQASIRSR